MASGEASVNAGSDHDNETRALVHEFRNLLAVIVNYSELIADEAGDPEAIRADIKEIRAAAERAIALTERLPRAGKPAAPGGAQGSAS